MFDGQPIRVLLIDSQQIPLKGLQDGLERFEAITIVGTALSAADGIKQLAELRPDVTVLALKLDGVTGLEVLNEITLVTKAVILTEVETEHNIFEAMMEHAQAYVLKSHQSIESLAAVIERVGRGEMYLDAPSTELFINAVRAQGTSAPLTRREREVLALIIRGASDERMAFALNCKVATVRTHVRHVYRKLGVRTRDEAQHRGIRLGYGQENGKL